MRKQDNNCPSSDPQNSTSNRNTLQTKPPSIASFCTYTTAVKALCSCTTTTTLNHTTPHRLHSPNLPKPTSPFHFRLPTLLSFHPCAYCRYALIYRSAPRTTVRRTHKRKVSDPHEPASRDGTAGHGRGKALCNLGRGTISFQPPPVGAHAMTRPGITRSLTAAPSAISAGKRERLDLGAGRARLGARACAPEAARGESCCLRPSATACSRQRKSVIAGELTTSLGRRRLAVAGEVGVGTLGNRVAVAERRGRAAVCRGQLGGRALRRIGRTCGLGESRCPALTFCVSVGDGFAWFQGRGQDWALGSGWGE